MIKQFPFRGNRNLAQDADTPAKSLNTVLGLLEASEDYSSP